MEFKKTELDFLKVFMQTMDTKRMISDKLRIKVSKNEVVFSLFSEFGAAIYSLKKQSKKEFEVIYPIQNFYNFVQLLKDDNELEISEGAIKITDSESEYQFDAHSISLEDSKIYLDLLDKKAKSEFTLKDLSLLQLAQSFAGKEELATVGLFSNNFVASDKIMACVLPTKNNLKQNIFLSIPLVSIISMFGSDEIGLSVYEKDGNDLIHFDLMGIKLFSIIQKFTLVDLTSDDLKKMYDHPLKVSVKKATLNEVLSRMKIFASSNVQSRVHLSLEKNKIKIENKEYNKSYEYVVANYDKELEGKDILLNCDLLYKLINLLSGDQVVLFLDGSEDMLAIKIQDEKEDRIFIQVLSSSN